MRNQPIGGAMSYMASTLGHLETFPPAGVLGYTRLMDTQTASQLNQLNTHFYQRVEASFSATRQAPWRGWRRIGELARQELPQDLTVLDLACGNLRFPKFLAPQFPSMRVWAVDNCDPLVGDFGRLPDNPGCMADSMGSAADDPGAVAGDLQRNQSAQGLASPNPLARPAIAYQHLDIVQTLLDGADLALAIGAPTCDLSVCFGFMHHLALPKHRLQVLDALVRHTRPGGYVAVSFWQFARDQRILAKAQPLQDAGDYLLGWQDDGQAKRYCHHYSDDEISSLVTALGPCVRMAYKYFADGKSNNLNCYIMLQII